MTHQYLEKKPLQFEFEYPVFRVGVYIFLALDFSVVGIMQLKDFAQKTTHGVSRVFPLSFFLLFGSKKNRKVCFS